MLFLGIDVSTQGVKCVVIDTANGRIAAESQVNFGRDLPQYLSPSGFLENPDPLVRQADPLMWLDALELALAGLCESGVDMAAVRGISGSGQQHGSVYLASDISELDACVKLSEQVSPLLSRRVAPIWMDRSTSEECGELESRFGAEYLCSNTGSAAIERFTAAQIRRFAKREPEAYAATRRIHLVSSLLCSVLCGHDAPLDYGDASGMNLLNLNTLKWDDGIVEFTAPGLMPKLPPAVASHTIAGRLDGYFTKFGLVRDIPVVVWSGDNPNSLVGVGAGLPGLAGISLGTSDTFFAPMTRFVTDPEGCGHVFGNCAGGFMSLICFTNGSLAREKVKDDCAVDWDFFDNSACELSPPGAGGRIFLPYFEPESTPLVLKRGVRRNYASATPAEEIRALLESQALSMRLHSAWQKEAFSRIRLTGGASKSAGLRQIIADVFQADVETIEVSGSAALGAAMRAANAVCGASFAELAEKFCTPVSLTHPCRELAGLYDEKLAALAAFEKKSGHTS